MYNWDVVFLGSNRSIPWLDQSDICITFNHTRSLAMGGIY